MSDYDEGYSDGEDNANEEWALALTGVVPVSLLEELTPGKVADYIAQLKEGKMR